MIGDSSPDDGGATAIGMQCLISPPEQMAHAFALTTLA